MIKLKWIKLTDCRQAFAFCKMKLILLANLLLSCAKVEQDDLREIDLTWKNIESLVLAWVGK